MSSEVLKQNLTPFFEATGLSIDDMADERIATKVAQSPYTLLSREEVAELKNNNKFEKLEENVMHIKEAQELQNVLIQAQENPQKVSVGFLDSFLVRDGEYRLVFNKSDYLTSYYGLIKFLGKEKAELAMNNIAVLFSEKGTVFSSECGDCVFFTFRSDDETWVFIENKTSRLLTVSDGQFSTDLQFISLENLKRREKNKTKEILEVLMRV